MSDYKQSDETDRDGDGKAGRRAFQVTRSEPTRAYVLVPWLKSAEHDARRKGVRIRSAETQLDEAVGLALAIDLNIVGRSIVPLQNVRPSTLVGEGKLEELKGEIAALDVELVVVDSALSPVQQRNLERAWKVKVVDRTGLILEIFGERANTREGALQVELAHLNYQKSRLVRSWTHLERQRGGLGFVGGPGETQIEADRRMLQERITKLERQLETVKRTRELHRKTRRDAPYPVVALVGYTNAGKSTLFNRVTEAGVFAENLLFATLDPTMRSIELPSGRKVILSDTVGFISDLPTHLVAAFRATLEEVLEAQLIIHVRDASHEETEIQKADVEKVLASLGVTPETMSANDQHVLEVLNKLDRLPAEQADALRNMAEREEDTVAMSALTGEGVETLLQRIDDLVTDDAHYIAVELLADEGEALAWFYRNSDVREREDREDGSVRLMVGMAPASMGRFEKHFPDIARRAGELLGEAAE